MAYSKTTQTNANFRSGTHTLNTGMQDGKQIHRPGDIAKQFGLLKIGNDCNNGQCQQNTGSFCKKIKECGHVCFGLVNERKCLPCLQGVCQARINAAADRMKEPKLIQDVNDICVICFETLACAPSIQLNCGHVLHYDCCNKILEKRWIGPRITFGFSLCPICKADIQHTMLAKIFEPIDALKQNVKRKALIRMQYEGVSNGTENALEMAMDRYAYYVCFKCKKPYYGGEARCDAEINEQFEPADLVCGGCSNVARAQMCSKHGDEFLGYKCRYCCSLAVYFCSGHVHYCDACHSCSSRKTTPCPAGPGGVPLTLKQCPLNVVHPPSGQEFSLGCGVCLNAQTF